MGDPGAAPLARDEGDARQQKDALGIVHFKPALTGTTDLRDHSWQVTPAPQNTGFDNVALRARLFLLHGGAGTDFGEKQNARKVELTLRHDF